MVHKSISKAFYKLAFAVITMSVGSMLEDHIFCLKRLQAVRREARKAESVLSYESNLTTSSDEGEQQGYLFTSSKPFSTCRTKLAN
jgi:hypothetical protein